MPETGLSLGFVVDSLHVGGGERHVVDLALALERQGHCVTIACSDGGPLREHLNGSSVQVRPLLGRAVKRTADLEYALALARLLSLEQFDIVHAHMYASAVSAALATSLVPLPLVVTEHTEGHWQTAMHVNNVRWYVSRAAHIIAVSRAIHRRISRLLPPGEDSLSLIPNAIAPPTAVDLRPMTAVTRFGIELVRVGVVARLALEKGHEVFLEAAAQVVRLVRDCVFVLIGDGPLKEDLMARAASLGLNSHVQFEGEALNARGIIGSLDVLVVPSLAEGTPLALLDALSQGVPVVATRVGGIPELFEGGGGGLLVPPGDAPALAGALVHLLQDAGLRIRLGREALHHARNHSYSAMLNETISVYSRVLRGREQTGAKGSPRNGALHMARRE